MQAPPYDAVTILRELTIAYRSLNPVKQDIIKRELRWNGLLADILTYPIISGGSNVNHHDHL